MGICTIGRLTVSSYQIQGMLFGLEWEYQTKWFSLNFGIFKVIVNYG